MGSKLGRHLPRHTGSWTSRCSALPKHLPTGTFLVAGMGHQTGFPFLIPSFWLLAHTLRKNGMKSFTTYETLVPGCCLSHQRGYYDRHPEAQLNKDRTSGSSEDQAGKRRVPRTLPSLFPVLNSACGSRGLSTGLIPGQNQPDSSHML